jgi:hypothetical protein
MIDGDNPTYALPCAFKLQRQGRDELELLAEGDQLAEIDDAGTIGVRSRRWVPLTADFQINRPLTAHQSTQWGTVNYKRLAAREGFNPNEIWTLSSDAQVAGKVRAQLEVTQNLAPFVHLCQWPPHYLAPDKPTVSLRRLFGEQYWLESEHRLSEIPAAVWVSGQANREYPEGVEEELFRVWLPDTEDITTYFDTFFRDGSDPTLEPRPGRVSAPLPRPKANGEYRFFLRWPDGEEKHVRTESVRGQQGPTSQFVATLDARGWLAVHRGYPPYWKASSLEAVQEYPGAVFRVPMEPAVLGLQDS